jgi:hypothetical protein
MVSSRSVVIGLATAAWLANEIPCWWLRVDGSGVMSVAGAAGAAGEAAVAVEPRRSSAGEVERGAGGRRERRVGGSARDRGQPLARPRRIGVGKGAHRRLAQRPTPLREAEEEIEGGRLAAAGDAAQGMRNEEARSRLLRRVDRCDGLVDQPLQRPDRLRSSKVGQEGDDVVAARKVGIAQERDQRRHRVRPGLPLGDLSRHPVEVRRRRSSPEAILRDGGGRQRDRPEKREKHVTS